MLLKLAFKSIISRRSSLVIILFITFSVCLFCLANAVFDSTEQGVQTNFIASFTGDFIIRPKSNIQQSLFGDETPITGELTNLNTIVPFSDISKTLEEMLEISGFTGQVSGAAVMENEAGSRKTPLYVFGLEGEEYLQLMKSIHVIKGKSYEPGERGVMLCSKLAAQLKYDVGDTVQFVVADGPNYRIRAAKITAIYEYDIFNEIFSRFVLTDPVTARSLFNIAEVFSTDSYELSDEVTNLFAENNDFSDFDDIFSQAEDLDTAFVMEESISAEDKSDSIDNYKSTAWNYIIVRLNKGQNPGKVMKKLSKLFKKNGWPVQVADWRHAAGSTALYLFWMRTIFNIGIIIVLSAGFIIVNNTLVINILDRSREIGTLRAIGAKKRFISLQCMVENLILTLTSGVLGVLTGTICTKIINRAHIVLNNSFLVQLFGADAINISVSAGNVFKLFLLVIILALLGWIYPVINALKVTPVDAIRGTK